MLFLSLFDDLTAEHPVKGYLLGPDQFGKEYLVRTKGEETHDGVNDILKDGADYHEIHHDDYDWEVISPWNDGIRMKLNHGKDIIDKEPEKSSSAIHDKQSNRDLNDIEDQKPEKDKKVLKDDEPAWVDEDVENIIDEIAVQYEKALTDEDSLKDIEALINKEALENGEAINNVIEAIKDDEPIEDEKALKEGEHKETKEDEKAIADDLEEEEEEKEAAVEDMETLENEEAEQDDDDDEALNDEDAKIEEKTTDKFKNDIYSLMLSWASAHPNETLHANE